MNEYIELIRLEIKKQGYLNATQIKLRLSKAGVDEANCKNILDKLVNNEIKKIKYTNFFVSDLVKRDLFYYRPPIKRKK